MLQVAQNYKTGDLDVVDVPAPACLPGGVLIRSLYSLISTGTELMKVSEARMSLLGKVRARPDQVRKVLDGVAQQGALATYQKAMNRLDSYTPLGYSLAGVVIEVGAGAEQFHVGQVVAAAGNEHALHAEINWVPTNLCVAVPAGVAPEHAAFATVGAIAMQGVRRAEVALGETACVIGLGLIGQIVVRLLTASGVGVVGLDPVPDRCRAAEKAGALLCAAPDDTGVAEITRVLLERTGGIGADHVLLAAGGDSNGPTEIAVKVARDRGRIVDIGKTKLDLPWNSYYEKELDVRFSRSYGPGRYDDRYELEGIDYPAGYVRWTERRNLSCFLDLLADGSVDVTPLVSDVRPVENAAALYSGLVDGSVRGLGFLLSYPQPAANDPTALAPTSTVAVPRTGSGVTRTRRSASRPVRMGFVGAGNYASAMLLPHLRDNPEVELVTVATNRALSGLNAQRKFGFGTMTTDATSVLEDDSLDAVFIVTRHHSHARLVCDALERGLAVFVEKPLALSEEQVADVLATVERTGNDRLMVGFNRRFAPLFVDLKQRLAGAHGPWSARYLVNAGRLDASSWYLQERLEGSRFAGEGGHFIDTVAALTSELPTSVYATAAGDSLQLTLRLDGGSVASISYLTEGSARYPKETLDVHVDTSTGRLDNFQRVTVWSGKTKGGRRVLTGQDKGQRAQLAAFVSAVRAGSAMPIDLDSLVATTRATLAVETSLASGQPVTW